MSESLTLTAADGVTLEAELRVPSTPPWGAAVLLHPHPLHGGSMRTGVPSYLFDSLPASGVAALRFNFRGVGASAGSHDAGVAERDDVVAALDALHPVVEGLPLVLAGWSFGADVSLAVDDDRVAGWLAVAPTLRVVPLEDMSAATDDRPKLLAVPQHDQFNPPEECRRAVEGWPHTRVEVVPGADHFLAGRLDRVAALALELLEELRPA